MYTRYELYLDGEPQNVGFIVGLQELDLDEDIVYNLIEDFDTYLPFPHIDKKYWKQTPLAYFTEKGLEQFHIAIQRLLDIYETSNFFDVVKLESTLSDKTIVYEDEYQVIAV